MTIANEASCAARLAAAALLVTLLGHADTAWAQPTVYTYTKIADEISNPGLRGVECVGMNNLGAVIVTFVPSGSGTYQLWRGDGQSFTQVAAAVQGGCSSINDLGETAHFAFGAPGITTLVRNSNGAMTTLASSTVAPYLYAPTTVPSLSLSGNSVFQGGEFPFTGKGIYIGPSGPTVYNPTAVVEPITGASSSNMNDNLVVVFRGYDVASGVQAIYRGSTVPLIRNGDAVSGGVIRYGGLTLPVINNAGTVAFVGRLDVGGVPGVGGIYTTDSGTSVALVGTDPIAPERLSINDAGAVAYRKLTGIYVGRPGAVDQPAATAGVAIDGSTLSDAYVWPESLNNKGQVAFVAYLADGRVGVFRADPVNHPPVAVSGTLSTDEDVQASGVLGASDADSDPLSFRVVTQGGRGTVAITNTATGAYTYTPHPNENGSDSFSFTANDGTDDADAATVTVTIAPVNDAPQAVDAAISAQACATVFANLTATDIDSASMTFSIVSNGSKGVAAITNAATGAYTYTANCGTSGTDSFTFKAADGLLDSNVATVTVTIAPAACAVNVTSSVSASLGSFRVDRKSGHYFQKVTLKNTSLSAITGPVSFVLDALTAGATVAAPAGVTTCATPAGSPYVNVNVGADGVMSSRERANVSVEFVLELVNPGGAAITYTPRILAGAGTR